MNKVLPQGAVYIDPQQDKLIRQMSELALTEAASQLSFVGNREIRMTVSTNGLWATHQVDQFFTGLPADLIAIWQRLEATQGGDILFILPQEIALLMTREMLNDSSQFKEMTDLEDQALTEIGNIIMNSFISHYSQVLNGSVSSSLPHLFRGLYTHIFHDLCVENSEDGWCYQQFNITTECHDFSGLILYSRFMFY